MKRTLIKPGFILKLAVTIIFMMVAPASSVYAQDTATEAAGLEEMLHRPDADYDALFRALSKAAGAGDTRAQYLIGTMYRDGLGMKQDYREASYWFRKAGRNGEPDAQLAIALMFAEGKGVLPDDRMAAEWMWRAAQGGNPEAQYRLGMMYLEGKGVPKDIKKAQLWTRKASEAGYIPNL